MEHERSPLDRAGRLTLVAAPLLTILARILSVPWDDSHPATYVDHLTASPTRADIGATLVVLAAALSVPAALHLTQLARRFRPNLGLTGGVLAVAGWIGVAGVGTKSLAAGQIVRHSSRDTAMSLTHHLASDVHAVDLLTLAGVVGFVLLAMCLYRDSRTPTPITVLVGVGGVSTMFSSQGPLLALNIGVAVLLLIGQSWLIIISRVPASTAPRAQADQARQAVTTAS